MTYISINHDFLRISLDSLANDHLGLSDRALVRAIRYGVAGSLVGQAASKKSTTGGLRPFPKPGVRKGEVENYIGAPIDEELQRRLGLFVAKHPDMTEEEAVAHLLDVALDSLERQTSADVSIERAAFRARLRLLREGCTRTASPTIYPLRTGA